MSKTKRNHTVQKAFLQNFSNPLKNKFYLYQFDKTVDNPQPICININDATVIRHFYPQFFENWLSFIEGRGINVINKIIRDKSVVGLTREEQYDLMAWIIIQDLRTKERRNELKQMADNLAQFVIQHSIIPRKYPQYKGRKLRIEFSDEKMKYQQIIHIKDMIEKCLPSMVNYRIYLLKNESNPYVPFYTADHPIMMDNVYYKKMKKYDNLIANGMGYLAKGVELYLPINSDLCLHIVEPTPYIENHIIGLLDNLGNKIDYQNVIYVNSRLVGGCNRFVYCRDNEFKIAYRMLKDFPECKSEMRKRGEIKHGLPPELIDKLKSKKIDEFN